MKLLQISMRGRDSLLGPSATASNPRAGCTEASAKRHDTAAESRLQQLTFLPSFMLNLEVLYIYINVSNIGI